MFYPFFRVALRSALVKEAKEQEEYESSLNALPSDEEAMRRNAQIRKLMTCVQVQAKTEHDELQSRRHKQLTEAYENMVQREVKVSKRYKNT